MWSPLYASSVIKSSKINDVTGCTTRKGLQETKGHTCEGLRLELRLQEGGVVLGLAQLRFLVSEEAHPALARHAICAALQASTKIVDMELLTSLAIFGGQTGLIMSVNFSRGFAPRFCGRSCATSRPDRGTYKAKETD